MSLKKERRFAHCTLALTISIYTTRKAAQNRTGYQPTQPMHPTKPATPDSRKELFRVHERARQRPKKRYLEAVEHVGIFVSVPCQKANESYVEDEKYPGQDR